MRAYNQSYNFFSGMNDAAVMAYQKDALTGHRPTWKMGTGKSKVRPDLRNVGSHSDPFSLFGEGVRAEQQARAETRPIRNAERKALDTLGLDVEATQPQVKARFKELVKRHHPDANGGDRSTEDRLVEIIQAYNYLKSGRFRVTGPGGGCRATQTRLSDELGIPILLKLLMVLFGRAGFCCRGLC